MALEKADAEQYQALMHNVLETNPSVQAIKANTDYFKAYQQATENSYQISKVGTYLGFIVSAYAVGIQNWNLLAASLMLLLPAFVAFQRLETEREKNVLAARS